MADTMNWDVRWATNTWRNGQQALQCGVQYRFRRGLVVDWGVRIEHGASASGWYGRIREVLVQWCARPGAFGPVIRCFSLIWGIGGMITGADCRRRKVQWTRCSWIISSALPCLPTWQTEDVWSYNSGHFMPKEDKTIALIPTLYTSPDIYPITIPILIRNLYYISTSPVQDTTFNQAVHSIIISRTILLWPSKT